IVSKASEDFPEPLTPVTTVMALCGISTVIFLRLWTRAPRTRKVSCSGMKLSAGAVISLVAKGEAQTARFRCAAQTLNYTADVKAGQTPSLQDKLSAISPKGITAPGSERFARFRLPLSGEWWQTICSKLR